jgi:thioredoxin reductase
MKEGAVPIGDEIDVAIIGAGPYGLSIAAHLNAMRVPLRIFGKPMSFWANQMPAGMRLKSEGFASSLDDPRGEFPLAEYCRREGLPYEDSGLPVRLETFVNYGLEFQRRFVPNLEEKLVTSVQRNGHLFDLMLEDGEVVKARNVVCAAGIAHFSRVPEELAALGEPYVSHSSEHSRLEVFRGKRVAVVGAGASAADLAALLRASGADVEMIVRGPRIRFHNPPAKHKPLKDRLLRPETGIGPGLRLAFYVNAPHIFQRFPESFRLRKIRDTLGPAPGWFIKEEVVGKVPIHVNAQLLSAAVENGEVVLRWTGAEGQKQSARFDHVIAATGFDVDIERLAFLSQEIRSALVRTGKSPLLSAKFESSVPGLYFAGVASANTFGPLMRFAYGARFTARRISRRLALVSRRNPTRAVVSKIKSGLGQEIGARSVREA